MPGFNQTGPEGQGPMTGRRMGRCTNYGAKLRSETETQSSDQNDAPLNDLPGRGFGFGWMRGRGRGGRGLGMGRQTRFRGGF